MSCCCSMSRGSSSSRVAGGLHRSTTMVPSAATVSTTTNRDEAPTTMKLKPQVDEEKRNNQVIIPRVLEWIMALVASPSSPPTMTIEEADRKAGIRPGGLFWFCAVYMLLFFIGITWILAYEMPRRDHNFSTSLPWWRPPVIVPWCVYMALVTESFLFMSLFLPRAPVALRKAFVEVGVVRVGVPLGWFLVLAACFGHTWMFVVLAYVFSVLFTGIIVLWVWLVRTYT